MRRGATRGVPGGLVAAGAGIAVALKPAVAFADMGFSPGFIRQEMGFGQFLLTVMACVALVSAAVGILGLWRMSKRGPDTQAPHAGGIERSSG